MNKPTSLQHRAKRVKPFRAYEPPVQKDTNEVVRVADVKVTKVKLPDGRVVFRRFRPQTTVQQETYTGSEPTSSNPNDSSNRFAGTDAVRKNYAAATPGQTQEFNVAAFAVDKPSYDSGRNDPDSYGQRVLANAHQAKKHFSDIRNAISGVRESNEINKAFTEATYKGKTVPLNKPMAGDVKKSKVYVDPDGDGKAKKVNFGDKTLSIKKGIPARKNSYCARSSGQGSTTDKSSANYWSRRAWDC